MSGFRKKTRYWSVKTMANLFASVDPLKGDKRRSLCSCYLNRAGRCERPVLVERHSRPERVATVKGALEKALKDYRDDVANLCDWEFAVEAGMVEGPVPGIRATPHVLRKRSAYLREATAGSRTVIIDRKKTGIPLFLEIDVPCGKCVACKLARSRYWFARTVSEWKRTRERPGCAVYLFTATFTPETHQYSRILARVRLAREGDDFDALSEERQFAERMDGFYSGHMTKFLMRMRKRGIAFRHFLMNELHPGEGENAGEPHFHMLIFDTDPDRPMDVSLVLAAWRSHARSGRMADIVRVNDGPEDRVKVMRYVVNYIMKSAHSRVRCSENFGDGISKRSLREIVKKMQADVAGKPAAGAKSEAPVGREPDQGAGGIVGNAEDVSSMKLAGSSVDSAVS